MLLDLRLDEVLLLLLFLATSIKPEHLNARNRVNCFVARWQPKSSHQVKRRLLLDVVVGEGTAVFQLLAGEDQALLVRRNACKTQQRRC